VTAAPVLHAASAGAARRLVQSGVVLAVLAVSAAAATLGLTLLTSANEGFHASVAAAHGAELAVTINASKVTAAGLVSTRRLAGVTGAAGPYPQATITITADRVSGAPFRRGQAPGGPSAQPPAGVSLPGGATSQQITVVGRPRPTGGLNPVSTGRAATGPAAGGGGWPSRRGEIVLDQRYGIQAAPGSKLTVASAPGRPALTVTGDGDEAVPYDGGWVAPGEIPVLRASGAPAHEQMLYTFTSAASQAQIGADLAELKHALPAGAVASYRSWLPGLQLTSGEASVNTPFVIPFAILGLVLAALIVANVVSAAVIAAYRRIGVLKSIGFTPAQVTATYLAQIGLPALAGAAVGTVLGNWWAGPQLNFGVSAGNAVPPWINITVPLGMLALTGLAALGPSLRAGRLSAVAAIAAGQAPPASPSLVIWRGYRTHRLAGRLALPRPVTIGLAAPFSRPARSVVTLAALTFGLAGVVFAASLNASIHKINNSALSGLGQVQVQPADRLAAFTASQDTAIIAALRAQPGTSRSVAQATLFYPPPSGVPPQWEILSGARPSIAVAGHVAGLVTNAYDGGSSWLGWNMLSGRWYRGPHEAVVSSQLLAEAGLHVGGSLALKVNGKPVTLRIAGEAFSPGRPTLFASWQALGGTAAGLAVASYDVDLGPGTSAGRYISALSRALGPGYDVRAPAGASIAAFLKPALFQLLATLVTVLAALGVLNSVLMATRERVHDLGIYKAVGMTPRQTIAMVISSVVPPAVIAAALALPAGLVLQDLITRHQAANAGFALPGSFIHVLGAADLTLLAVAGLGIAAVGALGPATWAATAKTTTALRTE
jgi:putative ABC transport system permease protein